MHPKPVIRKGKKNSPNASAAVRKALLDKYGVVTGTYDELKKIKKPGYQRDHVVPHSNFMTRSVNTKEGESRYQVPIRPEFGNYTEGEAITYFVYVVVK